MGEHTPPGVKDPLRRPATWTALATAAVTTLVGFGLPIPDQAATGLVTLVAVAGPLIVWWWGRRAGADQGRGRR